MEQSRFFVRFDLVRCHCCIQSKPTREIHVMLCGKTFCRACILEKIEEALYVDNSEHSLPECCESHFFSLELVEDAEPHDFTGKYRNRVASRIGAYPKLIEKGGRLLQLTRQTGEQARTSLWFDLESEFQDPSSLAEWGWELADDCLRSGWERLHMEVATNDLGFGKSDRAYRGGEWKHMHDVDVNDVLYPASIAHYNNVASVPDGAIVAIDNTAPRAVLCDNEPAPKLQRWSDVVYLDWLTRAGPRNVRDLKYVFRHTSLTILRLG